MEEKYLSVSEITAYLTKKFKDDSQLKNIYIKGEISNYSTAPSGHSYFTLKDKSSQIPAVLFKGRKPALKFKPEDGMKVIVKGNVEIYERDGKYQLISNKITEDGLGELYIAYEQLKKDLEKEGLFDKEHKKAIPKFPKRIGAITSQTGSVIRDIITTVKRRYPLCEILIFSTLVQGKQAAPQIVRQIKNAQKYDLDTLIIGRGGGSIEDLWPFNEESVTREIYNCEIPIISAVGHETDNTITDYVADLRAPTPTAAAELAVPKLSEIKNNIHQLEKQANNNINRIIQKNKTQLQNITEKHIITHPESIYEFEQMHLDNLIKSLSQSSTTIISKNKNKLTLLENSNIFKNPETIYKQKEQYIANLLNNLTYSSKNLISKNKNRLEIIKNNNALKNPHNLYITEQKNLTNQIEKISYASKYLISKNKNKLEIIKNTKVLKNPNEIKDKKQTRLITAMDKLEILNPLLTLKRGYSIAKSEGKVISSSQDVKSGDELDVEFDDGTVNTKVI